MTSAAHIPHFRFVSWHVISTCLLVYWAQNERLLISAGISLVAIWRDVIYGTATTRSLSNVSSICILSPMFLLSWNNAWVSSYCSHLFSPSLSIQSAVCWFSSNHVAVGSRKYVKWVWKIKLVRDKTELYDKQLDTKKQTRSTETGTETYCMCKNLLSE
jgi:hypothetical protein